MRRLTCVCGNHFIALRKTARFCSTKCRMAAHRNWKRFESSPLGKDCARQVTLRQARLDSVTSAADSQPSSRSSAANGLAKRKGGDA
jgi:hypothetical protein